MAKAKPPTGFTLTNANTSYEIVPANPIRSTVSIANLHSSAMVYLAIGNPAVLKKGFVLYPSQPYQMDAFDLSPEAIFAISDTAGVELAIQEIGA